MNDQELWQAIFNLHFLLASQVNDEASYQRYFEDNSCVFRVLGYTSHASFEKSSPHSLPFDNDRNFSPEPDFLCARAQGQVLTVFELKTPFVGSITTARTDGNRIKFKAPAESYLSQASEYVESISESPDARHQACQALGLDKIAAYTSCLVYGLAKDNDPAEITRLLHRRAGRPDILFYDILFDQLCERYASGRPDIRSSTGWCFGFYVAFPEVQQYEKAYITQYAGPTGDVLSAFLEDGVVVLECVPVGGERHRLSAPVEPKKAHYILFEFAVGKRGSYMSLSVDNVEHDLRFASRDVNFKPGISQRVLGADLRGKNGASFQSKTDFCRSEVLSIGEKLEVYQYCLQKAKQSPGCVEFAPESFLRKEPNSGSMVQEKKGLAPIYRESFPYR